jgi:hypothetical protein
VRIINIITRISLGAFRQESTTQLIIFAERSKQDITLLKKLMEPSNVQFRMLADKIANEILQCSIDFFNERQKNDRNENFESNLNRAISLVKLADSVAISSQVKQRANENLRTLNGMKDWEITKAIELLQSIQKAYISNSVKITTEVSAMPLGYNESINWNKVNKMIKESIDWEKVVDLIIKTIKPQHIEKIKNHNDDSKIKLFKSLVDFLLDKLSFTQTNKVKYLAYWLADNPVASMQHSVKAFPIWTKWVAGIVMFLLIIGLIWGQDGLEVVLIIAGILGLFAVIGWIQNL